MPENKQSVLLSQDENELIFSLLGSKCLSLATTVIELYSAGGRMGGDDWQIREMGVLCLVKDNLKRSYFFRLYCPLRRKLLWEHEVYNDMKYITPTTYLHTFEAEDCIVGFNFASEEEGDFVNGILLEKLENKRQRRQEKRNRASVAMDGGIRRSSGSNSIGGSKAMFNMGVPMPSWASESSPHSPAHIISTTPSPHRGTAGTVQNRKRIGKLSKADISKPKDFKHISHVGWDPEKGFNLEQINEPHLKEFFVKAGISERQLSDPDTRGFIYDFIERNGGMEAVKTEVGPPPPVPERNSRSKAPPPPPPPMIQQSQPPPPANPPPAPPVRTYPPRIPPQPASLPPSIAYSIPPKTPMSQPGSGSIMNIPPPPPVPAPPMPPPPPAFPPPSDSLTSDSRFALMQAIKEGTNLKPVSERIIDNNDKKSQDSRGKLMEEIRDFKSTKLNTVQPAAENSLKKSEGGLAGALAEALAKRAKVIQSDSSSGESAGEDDDDWD